MSGSQPLFLCIVAAVSIGLPDHSLGATSLVFVTAQASIARSPLPQQPIDAAPRPGAPRSVYVAEFFSRQLADRDLLASITETFETALINTGAYRVLNRRSFHQLLQEAQNEEQIRSMNDLTDGSRVSLRRFSGADGVIFGEVIDDQRSGEISISVTLESFDAVKHWKHEKSMTRGRLSDRAWRLETIRELIASIVAGPNHGSAVTAKDARAVLDRLLGGDNVDFIEQFRYHDGSFGRIPIRTIPESSPPCDLNYRWSMSMRPLVGEPAVPLDMEVRTFVPLRSLDEAAVVVKTMQMVPDAPAFPVMWAVQMVTLSGQQAIRSVGLRMPRGAPGVLEFDDETALIVKDQGTAQRIAEAVKTLVATCKRE